MDCHNYTGTSVAGDFYHIFAGKAFGRAIDAYHNFIYFCAAAYNPSVNKSVARGGAQCVRARENSGNKFNAVFSGATHNTKRRRCKCRSNSRNRLFRRIFYVRHTHSIAVLGREKKREIFFAGGVTPCGKTVFTIPEPAPGKDLYIQRLYH